MRRVRVVEVGAGVDVGSRVGLADSWWLRLRGLLGRPRPRAGEGMLLLDCDSVHTVGMRHALDVAFLDREGTVVRVLPSLRPWRVGLGGPSAAHALELPPGRLEETGIRPGHRLHWS